MRIILVVLWKENSDWTLNIVIVNQYKLFKGQSEVSAFVVLLRQTVETQDWISEPTNWK